MLALIFRPFSKLFQLWTTFWFTPTDSIQSSWFRLLFGATLFFYYLLRHQDLAFFYYDEGLISTAKAFTAIPEFLRPSILWFPLTNGAAYYSHLTLILLSFCLMLGIGTRYLAWVILYFHLSFIQRNPAIIYGTDIVTSHWLFYLGLTHCTQNLSLSLPFPFPFPFPFGFSCSAWFQKLKIKIAALSHLGGSLHSVGQRLFQIQLCIIYGYTGFEKLKGTSWWEGVALWNTWGNNQITTLDFGFVGQFFGIIAALTYMTIIYEVYFPIMIWIKKARPYWLAIGVLFHLGIIFSLGLAFFSLVMMAPYLFFCDSSKLYQWQQWLQQLVFRQRRRL